MKVILIKGDIVFFHVIDLVEKLKQVFNVSQIYSINEPDDFEQLKLSSEKIFVTTIKDELIELLDCDVDIYFSRKKEDELDVADLVYDTKIECAKAFELADRIGLEKKKMGELLNILKIKIYDCQLGCF